MKDAVKLIGSSQAISTAITFVKFTKLKTTMQSRTYKKKIHSATYTIGTTNFFTTDELTTNYPSLDLLILILDGKSIQKF